MNTYLASLDKIEMIRKSQTLLISGFFIAALESEISILIRNFEVTDTTAPKAAQLSELCDTLDSIIIEAFGLKFLSSVEKLSTHILNT